MDVREERRPLIPQFTLRWLLGLTTVCAFLFAILGMAVQGRGWAIGISVGLGAIVLLAAVYALFFGCASVAGAMLARRGSDQGESPFRIDSVDSRSAAPLGENVPVEAEIVS